MPHPTNVQHVLMTNRSDFGIYNCLILYFKHVRNFFIHNLYRVERKEDVDETYSAMIRRKNRSSVDGFIREIRLNQIIPSDINDLCMKYYHISNDRFDPELISDTLKLEKDTIITAKTDLSTGTALLSNIVSKGKHKWKFKFVGGNGYCYIGIYKLDHECASGDPLYDFVHATYFAEKLAKKTSYALNTQEGGLRGDIEDETKKASGYYPRCGGYDEEGIVNICLDLENYKLVFEINGKVVDDNTIDIDKTKYRAAIAFADANQGEQIECLSYEMYS